MFHWLFDNGEAANNGAKHAQKLVTVDNALNIPRTAPPFFNLWGSLEGITANTTYQDIYDYFNAFCSVISSANNNYSAGVYYAYNHYDATLLITGQVLDNIPTSSFWLAPNAQDHGAPTAGYKILQTCISECPTCNCSGISIDRDSFQANSWGGFAAFIQKVWY